MKSIDETKKKLNIDELDKQSRKEMFNKFVSKGGQIIEEKKPKFTFDRNNQLKMKQSELRKKKENSEKKTDSYFEKKTDELDNKNNQPHYSVFIKGFFFGIFGLNKNFKKKFSDNIRDDFFKNLLELTDFLGNFLGSAGEQKWKNVDMLNMHYQFGYEILIRINDLNKNERNERIINFFSRNERSLLCSSILNDIYKIFKELLVLFPYWESVKEIIWKSSEIYRLNTNIELSLTKSRIGKIIDKMFSYYFIRFLTIINYNTGRNVIYDFDQIIDSFPIPKNLDMGSITDALHAEKKEYLEKLKKEKEEALKKIQAEIEKKELEKIPRYIQKGLEIIDNILENSGTILENNPKLRSLQKNEKMLFYFIIFNEFDREYSFILTTSQIKFNPKLEDGKRIDIKQDFEELYIRFNEINSFIREYIELAGQSSQTFGEIFGSISQNREVFENIDKKKTIAFNELKTRSINFFKKFALSLQTIIKDYNLEKRLLLNPEDQITFQFEKSSKKKFENATIINAVLYTFSFASAIHYYLENGKLSGKSIYFTEEKDNDDIKSESEKLKKRSELSDENDDNDIL